jgi:hypothetical protein
LDLEHVLDRLHPADRIFHQRPAVGECADHPLLAVVVLEIDRRAAHAGDAAGVLEVRAFAGDQHHIVLRVEIVQDGEDLDLEALDLRPFEDRQPVPFHAGADFADAHVAGGVEEFAVFIGASKRGGEKQGKTGSGGNTGHQSTPDSNHSQPLDKRRRAGRLTQILVAAKVSVQSCSPRGTWLCVCPRQSCGIPASLIGCLQPIEPLVEVRVPRPARFCCITPPRRIA